MRSNRFTRFLLTLCAIAALSLAARDAHAQCAITGPAEFCGSPVTLCGPDGSEFYVWTFPDGAVEYAQCITANAVGPYELRYIDPITHDWAEPCTRVLTDGGSAPVIAGGSTACEGESLELCGPAGNFEYEWSGPGGIASAASCISATAAGNYQLRVRPLPDGCWSGVAEHAVSFTVCEPPQEMSSCPRPVWWWAKQCPGHDSSQQRIEPVLLEEVAACVAERDPWLPGGLCGALLANPRTLEVRARRQVAAVWANICAGEMGLASRDGRPVSLDPAAAVNVAGYQGTVASWLESAGSQMRNLPGGNHNRESKEALRRLVRVAWHINRGIGIGEVCAPPADGAVAGTSSGKFPSMSSMVDDSNDPEPLAAELMDDSDAALAFGAIEPNPSVSNMTMGYSITDVSASEVVIGVYDVSGRMVRELVRAAQAPGRYVARWDGRDSDGAPVRGGMYFVMGRIGGDRVQSRVTLLR